LGDSLIDLAGLDVGAEDFLAAVLRTATQPIWVVDQEGVIRFANPAAFDALGYERAEELLGRHSHATIHHTRPDGTPYPAEECPMLLPRTTGETVVRELDWFFRRDGSMFPVSYVSVPIELGDGRGAVVAFSDIEDRLRAERVVRERDELLASQQASLRRVAALVAGGAASGEVFAAIAREVGQVMALPMVAVWKYDSDGTASVIGEWCDRPHPFRVGTSWPLDGPTVTAKVRASGRPARVEDFGELPGTIAGAARETGIGSCAGAPIVVDGEIWGAMSVDTFDPGPLADGIESRLAEFTALVATAISNTASREALVQLAGEQAALRRVATLVADGAAPGRVFDAAAAEMEQLLGADEVALCRYEPGDELTVVAHRGLTAARVPPGSRVSHEGETVAAIVRRTERPVTLEYGEDARGPIVEIARRLGVRTSVAAPLVVDGRLWGVIQAGWIGEDAPPPDTEPRMAQFAELLDTSIANADTRDQLTASRARLLTEADEARRRVVRDLHDGAQQWLVHTILTLKLAHEALAETDAEAGSLVAEALEQAERSNAELRELAHGILPPVLTRGGLRAALDAVVERLDLPVSVDVPAERLPAEIEASAYFIVAEALTNAVKHSRAGHAEVAVSEADGTLSVEVRDDGIGGADPGGHGLVGLGDRVTALGGRLSIDSPQGGGTVVTAELPVAR
jgi:PAS domain S-box-containing protein